MSEDDFRLKRIEDKLKAKKIERQLLINRIKQIKKEQSKKTLRQQAEDLDYLCLANNRLSEIKVELEDLENSQKEILDKSIKELNRSFETSKMTIVHSPVQTSDKKDEKSTEATAASGIENNSKNQEDKPLDPKVVDRTVREEIPKEKDILPTLGPFAAAQQKQKDNLGLESKGAIPKIIRDSKFDLNIKRKKSDELFLVDEKNNTSNQTNMDQERKQREEAMNTFFKTGENPPNFEEKLKNEPSKYTGKRPDFLKIETPFDFSFTPQKHVKFVAQDTSFHAPENDNFSKPISGLNINDSINLKKAQSMRTSQQYEPAPFGNEEQDIYLTPNKSFPKMGTSAYSTPDMVNQSRNPTFNRNLSPQRPVRLQRPFGGAIPEENVQEQNELNELNATYTVNTPSHRSNSMEVLIPEDEQYNSNHFRSTSQNRSLNSNIDRNSNRARPIFLKRLNNIPEFDGESFENLKKFLDKVETLYYSATNNAESNELFEHVLLKLNGEARDLIVALDHFDWAEMKGALVQHYAHLCNKNLVTTQLENIRQGEKETLTEYSERARKLLRTKNAMYSNLTKEQREEHNRIAYKAYMKGLNNTKLKERVVTRGASSLDTAIENAIDMELDTQNQIQSNELFCKACRNIGHRERDCRSRNNGDNAILKFVSALRNIGPLDLTRNPNMSMNRNWQNRHFQGNMNRNNWNTNNSSQNNKFPLGPNRNFENRMNENRDAENRNWNTYNFNRNENNNSQPRQTIPNNFNRNRTNSNPNNANTNNTNFGNNRQNQVKSIALNQKKTPQNDDEQEN